MFKTAIGIYKIPALWDRTEKQFFENKSSYNANNDNANNDNANNDNDYSNIKFESVHNIENFNEHASRLTSIKDNIYFRIFIGLVEKFTIKESHYIFIDETLTISKRININGIFVWILKDKDDLMYFRFADLFFLRGNYVNFYNYFVPSKSKIIFYPATSLIFNYVCKENNKVIKQNDIFKKEQVEKISLHKDNDFYNRIDYALVHEDPIYQQIFKNVKDSKNKYIKNINLYKFSSDNFSYLNLKREYDFIFVGDAVQATKNHQLLFEFINYCENKKLKLRFIYVSNDSILKDKIDNFIEPSNFKYVSLDFYTNQKPRDLNSLFNKSKVNLTFSGRDACPRTISESLAAGCYNIALDTLSDGKSYYDGFFGEIIGDKNCDLVLRKSRSISYVNADTLWDKIIYISERNFKHNDISKNSREKFSLQNLIDSIVF